jgi:hypothetical protein
MNIFNRKELILTRDLNQLNQILGVLASSDIKYRTKTNSILNSGRTHGIPSINADYAYQYRVYVHRDADYSL